MKKKVFQIAEQCTFMKNFKNVRKNRDLNFQQLNEDRIIMETHSFIVYIKIEDIYSDIAKDVEIIFDS